MSEFLRRLRFLFSRGRFERELEEELHHHLALSGDTPRFGNITLIREDSRAMWTFAFWEQFAQDIRYGLRAMTANKLFTAMAALSLALGIGANTAIYSFMDAIMLRALPVRHPEQLVVLNWHATDQPNVIHSFYGGGYRDPKRGFVSGRYPYGVFELLRANHDVLSNVFAFDNSMGSVNVIFDGRAEIAKGQFVSGGYFTGLGVGAVLGRLIVDDDDRVGAPRVAVLTNAYWRRRFAADPGIAGKTVLIDNVQYVVAGVAAPEFYGTDASYETQFFLPLHAEPEPERFANSHFYWANVMGRLRPGVSLDAAQAPLAGVFSQFVNSTASAKERADLPSLVLQEGASGIDSLRRRYSEPLRILMAMVALILTIACANIASLLLSRASARRREIAVRLSLGAGRARIVRQLLTESLLLSLAGGALAFLVAYPAIRLIDSMLAPGNNNLDLHVAIDWRVFSFTLALAVLAGIAFGLVPAFQATKVDVAPALKGMRTATTRRRWFGVGHALVVGQIALSLLLVIGAGLFVRTLSNLESIDLGFQRENVLLFHVLARQPGQSDDALAQLYETLRVRFAAIPGVGSASLSNMALVSGSMSAGGVTLPGKPLPPELRPSSSFMSVGPAFFSTMGIPMLMGREIGERDGANRPRVGVINQVFAEKYFPGENPLGRTIGVGKTEVGIVGVAKTARYDTLKRDIPPILYTAYNQREHPWSQAVYELRTERDPLSFANAVRRIVADAAPRAPIMNLTTQSDEIDASINQEMTFADLCTAFAALALIIACVGLYGLMAYAVSRRTNEIGIRMALGAQRRRIVWMVLREALALCSAGLAIGLACAWGAQSVVKSFLFGMKAGDPPALIVSVALLTGAALVAGYAPAWRASRIDPMAALRHE